MDSRQFCRFGLNRNQKSRSVNKWKNIMTLNEPVTGICHIGATDRLRQTTRSSSNEEAINKFETVVVVGPATIGARRLTEASRSAPPSAATQT